VGFTGWDLEHHDPAVQPVWEICSVHGVYEEHTPRSVFTPRSDFLLRGHTLRDALEAGHVFGFCAGTDSHGLLYHHGITPRRDPHRAGLTAVFGAPLTREGILGALQKRQCYATSGAQILLAVTLDDTPMGGEWGGDGDSAMLQIWARGTAEIESITIVQTARERRIDIGESAAHLTVELDVEPGVRDFVYVRVVQVDEDMAWSSPIFVGPV